MRIGLFILFLLAFSPGAYGRSAGEIVRDFANWCMRRNPQAVVRVPYYDELPETKAETIEELFRAFQRGTLPVPGNPAHEVAFEIYLAMKVGQASPNIPKDAMKRIQAILTKYPHLRKDPFRTIEVVSGRKEYERTKELDEVTKKILEDKKRTEPLLFSAEPDLRLWGKLKSSRKGRMEALVTEADLAVLFDDVMKTKLGEEKPDSLELHVLWFQRLAALRDKKEAEGCDVTPISNLLLSLVNGFGIYSPKIANKLESRDGQTVLDGIREMTNARHNLAEHLGYELGYGELLKKLKVQTPKDIHQDTPFDERMVEIERGIQARPAAAKGSSKRWIRQLSLYESAFRSCLGQDCSSSSYFGRALDPNYHYFTITNPFSGESDGHVTVVLGEAKGANGKVKVAFVDKIQNISNTDLPQMLEAIRQSVAEKGYELAIPTDLGDHNGISNQATTRLFVEKDLRSFGKQNTVYGGFHSHPHEFKNVESQTGYSRADHSLDVKPLLPISGKMQAAFTPGEMPASSKLAPLDMEALRERTIALKHGDTNAKIQYIEAAPSLARIKGGKDLEYTETLDGWAKDPAQPISLRNRIAGQALLEGQTEWVKEILNSMPPVQRRELIQNWLQTPRFAAVLLKNKAEFFPYALGHLDSMKKLTDVSENYPNQLKWLYTNHKHFWNDRGNIFNQWIGAVAAGAGERVKREHLTIEKIKQHARDVAREKRQSMASMDQAIEDYLNDSQVAQWEKNEVVTFLFEVGQFEAANRNLPNAHEWINWIGKKLDAGKNGNHRVEDISPYLKLIPHQSGDTFFFNKHDESHQQQLAEHLSTLPDWTRDPVWAPFVVDASAGIYDPILAMNYFNKVPAKSPAGQKDAFGDSGVFTLHQNLSRAIEYASHSEQGADLILKHFDSEDPTKISWLAQDLVSGGSQSTVRKVREQLIPKLPQNLRDFVEGKIGEATFLELGPVKPVEFHTGPSPHLLSGELFWHSGGGTTFEELGVFAGRDAAGGIGLLSSSGPIQRVSLPHGLKGEIKTLKMGPDLLAVTGKGAGNTDDYIAVYRLSKDATGKPEAKLLYVDKPSLFKRNKSSLLAVENGLLVTSNNKKVRLFGENGEITNFEHPGIIRNASPTGDGRTFVAAPFHTSSGETKLETFIVDKNGKKTNARDLSYPAEVRYTPNPPTQIVITNDTIQWFRNGQEIRQAKKIRWRVDQKHISDDGTIYHLSGDEIYRYSPDGSEAEIKLPKLRGTGDRIVFSLMTPKFLVMTRGPEIYWVERATGKVKAQQLTGAVSEISANADGSITVLLGTRRSAPEVFTQVISPPQPLR